MEIKASDVKKLRDLTSAGMMDAKAALHEAKGDFDKAVKILQEKGAQIAESKSGRNASQGLIVSYIHPGDKIGVLLELNCETDFVAKADDFKKLGRNIAMHIAGMDPLYVDIANVPEEIVKKEKELYKSQLKGKAKEVQEKAIEGKLSDFYASVCLLKQPYVLDQEITVEDLISRVVGIIKENIKVSRFVRFEIGGDQQNCG